MSDFNIDNYKKRMLGAIDNMKINFQGLRSGRASSALVDNITLDAYGQTMKIKDVKGCYIKGFISCKQLLC